MSWCDLYGETEWHSLVKVAVVHVVCDRRGARSSGSCLWWVCHNLVVWTRLCLFIKLYIQKLVSEILLTWWVCVGESGWFCERDDGGKSTCSCGTRSPPVRVLSSHGVVPFSCYCTLSFNLLEFDDISSDRKSNSSSKKKRMLRKDIYARTVARWGGRHYI